MFKFMYITSMALVFMLFMNSFAGSANQNTDTNNKQLVHGPNSARFITPLEFDKEILVGVAVGTSEQPDIVTIKSVRFEMRDGQIFHKLDGFLLRPWPHTDWRFRFELLSADGSVVGSIKYNMHNRGRNEADRTNEPEAVQSNLCPIGPKGLEGTSKPTHFAITIEQKQLETKSITRTHSIFGTLVDATEDMPEDFLERFGAAQSQKEADEIFRKKLGAVQLSPLPNVQVTLRGKLITKQAVTDEHGKFSFSDLPGPTFGPYGGMGSCESYEIIAQIPVQIEPNGFNRMASVTEYVKLDSDKNITLKLRKDLINVKGKVIDVEGRPIPGAKVIAKLGINDPAMDGYWETHTPPKWVTMSQNDGSYELQGIEPTHFYRVSGYLVSGNPYKYIDIQVKADNYVQDENDIPRVPLVSAKPLSQARRFLKLANQIAQKSGRPEMHESKGVKLPSVYGNNIADVNITSRSMKRLSQ